MMMSLLGLFILVDVVFVKVDVHELEDVEDVLSMLSMLMMLF